MKYVKRFNQMLESDIWTLEPDIWTIEETDKLIRLGFNQEDSTFTVKFKDNASSMVTRRRLQDIIYVVSKENMEYKIRAKFPASRSHLNKGELSARKGKLFDNIDNIPNILNTWRLEMINSPDIYSGNG